MAIGLREGGRPDEPDDAAVPASHAQQVSSDLGDVLKSAPDLKVAPGVALAIARYGGPVTENAQQVAGVAKSRSIETGADRLQRDVGPDGEAMARQKAQSMLDAGGGLGSITQGLGDVEGAVAHNVEAIPGAVAKVATGAAHDVNQQIANSPLVKKIAPAQQQAQASGAGLLGQIQGVTTNSGKSFGSEVAQQANQVFTMPSHIYRTWYDTKVRYGPADAFEGLLPLIGGAVVGGLATRSPEGAESTEAAVASALGDVSAGSEEAAAETGPELSAAQRTGQAVKAGTKAVLKPPVVAGKAVAGAVNAVATSPAALGGEIANEAAVHAFPQSLFASSWKRTADATKWTLPDGKVGPTFGQAVTGAIGLTKGAQAYNALSGVLDAFMYVGAPDPLGAAGRVLGKANAAEGFGESFLGRHIAGGTAGVTPSGVESAVTQYPQIKAAMKDITGMDSAGQIAEKYPLFAPIAGRLSKTTTLEETKDIFKDVARTQELHTTSGLPELGPYSASKSAGRSVTGIFTPAPTTFDEEAQHFVGRTMNVGSDTAVPALMQMLRAAGEDRAVVQQFGHNLAGIGDPRIIMQSTKNAMKDFVGNEMLKSLPHDSPSDFKQATLDAMGDAIDNLFGGNGAGHVGQFGRDMGGGDLSRVYTDPGDPAEASRAAAIWFNQADKFKIPSTREIKQTIAELAQAEKWTAKNAFISRGTAFEQFIDHNINERIFQPLALATMGWATRVSISEAAMNILRQGPLNFTAGRIASSAAKQNWAMKSDELGHFTQAIHGVLAGIDESAVKALGRERILDAATSSMAMFNGHVVSPALDGTHAPLMRGTDQPEIAAADTRSYLRRKGILPGLQTKIKNVPLSDHFTQLAPGDTGYFRSMSEVNGRIAHDKLGEVVAAAYQAGLDAKMSDRDASALAVVQGKKFLDDMPETEISHMARHYARSRDSTLDPHGDWAVQAVTALKGAVTGADGTFHAGLLRDIVDKKVADVRSMAAEFKDTDPASLPYTFGREVQLKTADVIQRASNSLHSHVLGPVVNALSREPTWVVDYATERKLLERNVKAGSLTQDQADVIAADRAAYKSIRFVHNPLDRLKVENMMHTFAPFYFAQNQALRRAGRLLASNPGAFEQYLKAMLAANNVAHAVTLKNGTPTVIIPGTTLGGEGITAALHALGISPSGSIPIGLTGGADVSTTINPFSSADTDLSGPGSSIESALKPSFGPVAAIPLKSIAALFDSRSPTIANIANKMLGPISASEPLWEQFVPNSILQHAAQGIAGGVTQGQETFGSSYTSILMSVMASMAEAGQLPKGSSLLGSLNSDTDPPAMAQFIKQANNVTFILWMGRTIASGASPVTVSLGQAGLAFSTMAQDYINKAKGNISVGLDNMTRAHPNLVPSEVFKSASPDGYAFPETEKAAEWITSNQKLVDKYPTASRWLMPNTDATGQFSDQAYNMELAHGLRTKLTPSQFFDQIYISSGDAYYFDVVQPQIKAALAEKPGNSQWAYQIYTQVDADLKTYGTTLNPIWYKNWTAEGSSNLKVAAVTQMKAMLADPSTPKSPLATDIGFLVNLYDQFQGEKTQGRMTSTQLKAQWGALMTEATNRYPDTKQVVQSVFLGLG